MPLRGIINILSKLRILVFQAYNGFNLIVGNFKAQEVVYLTNRGPSASKALPLEPGLYGISNGNLESNWPKVDRGKQRLQVGH